MVVTTMCAMASPSFSEAVDGFSSEEAPQNPSFVASQSQEEALEKESQIPHVAPSQNQDVNQEVGWKYFRLNLGSIGFRLFLSFSIGCALLSAHGLGIMGIQKIFGLPYNNDWKSKILIKSSNAAEWSLFFFTLSIMFKSFELINRYL
jgi:hypothetical protein